MDADLKKYRRFAAGLVAANLLAGAISAALGYLVLACCCMVWAANCALWAHAAGVSQNSRNVNRELIEATRMALAQMGQRGGPLQ